MKMKSLLLAVVITTLLITITNLFSTSRKNSLFVEAVACSGVCASTLFPAYGVSTSICSEVSATVTPNTAATPATLEGTGIYSVATNLELAAIHAGFGVHGTAVTIYVYWAGQRTSFYSSTRYGLTSTSSASTSTGTYADFGFWISNLTGQCNEAIYNESVTPISNPIRQSISSCTSSQVTGVSYYHYSSDISCMLDWEDFNVHNETPLTAYIIDIGFRRAFYSTAKASLTTGLSTTSHMYVSGGEGARGIIASEYNDTVSEFYHGAHSTFNVTIDLSNQALVKSSLLGEIIGTNPFYSSNSSLATAAWHAGCAIPGTIQTCWVTPQLHASRFYASGMNGVETSYLDLEIYVNTTQLMGGYTISRSFGAAPLSTSSSSFILPNGETTVAYLTMDGVIKNSINLPLVGATVYTSNSDVQKAAFHCHVRSLYQSGEVYIHEVARNDVPPMLFGFERQGVVSQTLADTSARLHGGGKFIVFSPKGSSSSSVPPTIYKNETRIIVQPKFWKPNTVVGTGVYTFSSDFLSAVLHAGLATFGEIKEIYVTFVGTRSNFYRSTNGPFSSSNRFGVAESAFALTVGSYKGYFGEHGVIPVQVSATDATRVQSITGTSYYTRDSDITAVALHLGLIQWQQSSVMLFLHETDSSSLNVQLYGGGRKNFLSSTRNQIRSHFASYSTNQHAITLSLNSVLNHSNLEEDFPSDPSVAPMKVMITHEYLLRNNLGKQAVGARVYQASTTDLRIAAVLDGYINLHETKQLWIHWLPAASINWACFPSTSFMLSKSNSSATSLTPSGSDFFVIHDSATPPAADLAAVAQGIFRTRVYYSATKARKPIWGTHYYRYDSDLATAAMHAGILDLTNTEKWQTIYVHISGTAPYFFSSGGNSNTGYIFSRSSSSPACSFRVSTSATPLSPLDFADFPIPVRVEYFGKIWGTNFYSLDSEIGTAALHSRLVRYNETNSSSSSSSGLFDKNITVYVKILPTSRKVFYSSTMNDVSSFARFYSSSTSGEKAFVLGLQPGAPTNYPSLDNPMAVQLRLLNIPRYRARSDSYSTSYMMPPTGSGSSSQATDGTNISASSLDDDSDVIFMRSASTESTKCIGAGYYDVSSDLTLAAIHNGLLQVGELKTLWVHQFVDGRMNFVGAVSRGIACLSRMSTTTNTAATIILSETSSTPTILGTDIQVANITARQTTCQEDTGGGNAPAIIDPFPNLSGFDRFGLDDGTTTSSSSSSGDLAAVAVGAALRGIPSLVKFWIFPGSSTTNQIGFIPRGTGLSGVTSTAKFTSSYTAPYYLESLTTFSVTPASSSTASPISTILPGTTMISYPISINYPGIDALPKLQVWGLGGKYHYNSDVVGAAIHQGLLAPYSAGPVTVWIHFSKNPLQSFIGAISNGIRSQSLANVYDSYFQLTLNSTSPTPSGSSIMSAELKWTSSQHASNETANYAGCYPYHIDATYAAMKEGLIRSPPQQIGGSQKTTKIYLHQFQNKYILSPTSTSSSSSTSTNSNNNNNNHPGQTLQSCYLPSLSSTPPISHAIPVKVFGSAGWTSHLQQNTFLTSSGNSENNNNINNEARKLFGTDCYSLDSDVNMVAFHQGLILDGEEKLLYLHVSSFDYSNFFASTRHGVSSSSQFGVSQRCFKLSVSPVPVSFSPDTSPFVFEVSSPWLESSIGKVTGTSYYTRSSDLTFAAAHNGMFKFSSDRSQKYQIVVHFVGSRRVFLGSVFDGVRSLDSNSQDLPAMMLSTSTLALPGCMTNANDVFYAPIRGGNPNDGVSWLSTSAFDATFSPNSDVSRASTYRGLVPAYTLRYIKIQLLISSSSSSYTFTSTTAQNGIVPVSYSSSNVSFSLSSDTTCTVPGWPTEMTTLAQSPTCTGRCALTLFPLGPTTTLGTSHTVVVAADPFSTGESLDGTGAYSLWSDIQKTVVHNGLMYPMEVKQIVLVYVGTKIVIGSSMRGVTSYGIGGGTRYPCIQIYLSGTSPTPTFSYDSNVIGPVSFSFAQFGLSFNISKLKGVGIYKIDSSSDAVAAAYHTIASGSQNGTYSSEVTSLYIHNRQQQKVFYSSTVGSGCSQGENVSSSSSSSSSYDSAPAFSISSSSSNSEYDLPSNNSIQLRFPPIVLWSQCRSSSQSQLLQQQQNIINNINNNNGENVVIGAGVYPYITDLVVAAVQQGLLDYVHHTSSLNITDIGVVDTFWGHFSRGVLTFGLNNSVTKFGGIVLFDPNDNQNQQGMMSPINSSVVISWNVTELVAMNASTTSTTNSTPTTTMDPNATTSVNTTTSTTTGATTTQNPIVYVNMTVTKTQTIQVFNLKVDFDDVPEASRLGAKVFGTPVAYSPTSNMLLAAAHSADPEFYKNSTSTGLATTALALPYFPKAVIHAQRRNGILSQGLAATEHGDTLDTVRVVFKLPSRPYIDTHGPFATEIDLGGSIFEVGRNVSLAGASSSGSDSSSSQQKTVFGASLYGSDSEIALSSLHASVGFDLNFLQQTKKVCAFASEPGTRYYKNVPGAVGGGGVRSCATSLVNQSQGRFTLSFGGCHIDPVVKPNATVIPFNLTTNSLVDADYSTTCFGFEIFGGDVKRAAFSKFISSNVFRSSSYSSNGMEGNQIIIDEINKVSTANGATTIYITPLGEVPALPTSSGVGCAAFSGNVSSSSSSTSSNSQQQNSQNQMIPAFFVSLSPSENISSNVIIRGDIHSGNFSMKVNASLDANASTLMFSPSNSGSLCKGDGVYTIDTDILCSAYRHGHLNFGDVKKELIVDVLLPSSSSSSSSSTSSTNSVSSGINLYGTWRRGHRSVHSGDFRTSSSSYSNCMATTASSSSSSSSTRTTLPRCSTSFQDFEDLCLEPIHFLLARNQVVGLSPFSVNSDVALAAAMFGAMSYNSSLNKYCVPRTQSSGEEEVFSVSASTAQVLDFAGGTRPNPISVASNSFSCPASAMIRGSVLHPPLCTTVPAFVVNSPNNSSSTINSGSLISSSSSSSDIFTTNSPVKVTVSCEFEENILTNNRDAAGLTIWSPGTDLGLVALMQFGCKWQETVELYVSYIPVPPQLPYFVSTCAFGVCGNVGVPTSTDPRVMLVTQSYEDSITIPNVANTSFPVNLTGNFPLLGNYQTTLTNMSVTGAGRYPLAYSLLSVAGLFEGANSPVIVPTATTSNNNETTISSSNNPFISSTATYSSQGNTPLGQIASIDFPQTSSRVQLNTIGFAATTNFLSTSRLGFETNTLTGISSLASYPSFAFISAAGFSPEGNETDYPTRIALNNQVPARYYDTTSSSTTNQGFGRYNKNLWSVPLAALHSGIVDGRNTHLMKFPVWIRSAQPGSGLPFLLGATARGLTTTTLSTLPTNMISDWFFVAMNGGEAKPRMQVQPEYRIDRPVVGTGDYTIDSLLSTTVIHSGIAEVDDARFLVPVEIFEVTSPATMLVSSRYGDIVSQVSLTPNATTIYMLHQMTTLPACRRGTNWLVVDVRSCSNGQLGTTDVAGPLNINGTDYWYQHTYISSAVVQTGYVNRGAMYARINISFGTIPEGSTFPAVLRNTLYSRSQTIPTNQTGITIQNASTCEYVSHSVSPSLTLSDTLELTPTNSLLATPTFTDPGTRTVTRSATTWTVTIPSRSRSPTFTKTSTHSVSMNRTMSRAVTPGKSLTKTKSLPYYPVKHAPDFAIGSDVAVPILWAAGPVSLMAMLFGGSPVNGLYSTSALAVVEFSLCFRDNVNGSLRFPETALPGFTVGRDEGQHVRGALVANMTIMIILACILLLFGAIKANTKFRLGQRRAKKEAKAKRKLAAAGLTNQSFAGGTNAAGDSAAGSLGSPLLLGPDQTGTGDEKEDETSLQDFFDHATQEAWYPGSYILCSSIFLEGIVVSVTKLLIQGPDVLDAVLCCLGIIMGAQLVVVAWTVVSRSFHGAAAVRFCQSYVRVLDPQKHESLITRFLRSEVAATMLIGNYCWAAKKGTEDSVNNVLPLESRPAGLLVLPFRARNPDESSIIALAMRYFFVEAIIATIVGVARGVQEPCGVWMWIVAGATLAALLLQIRVRPYVIPFYNTTAAWTNAGITAAAFCIAAYHSEIAGEQTRLVGEIMAMMAALGGTAPLLNYAIRTFLLWSVSADVAPLGLQDESRSPFSGGAGDSSSAAGSPTSKSKSRGKTKSAGGSSPNAAGSSGENVGKIDGSGGEGGEGHMDEFELADMIAQRGQPVNWPLRPADDILPKLAPHPQVEYTDAELFAKRNNGGNYRHSKPIFGDEQQNLFPSSSKNTSTNNSPNKNTGKDVGLSTTSVPNTSQNNNKNDFDDFAGLDDSSNNNNTLLIATNPNSPRVAAGTTPDAGNQHQQLQHPLLSQQTAVNSPSTRNTAFAVVVDGGGNNKKPDPNDDFADFDFGINNNNAPSPIGNGLNNTSSYVDIPQSPPNTNTNAISGSNRHPAFSLQNETNANADQVNEILGSLDNVRTQPVSSNNNYNAPPPLPAQQAGSGGEEDMDFL